MARQSTGEGHRFRAMGMGDDGDRFGSRLWGFGMLAIGFMRVWLSKNCPKKQASWRWQSVMGSLLIF